MIAHTTGMNHLKIIRESCNKNTIDVQLCKNVQNLYKNTFLYNCLYINRILVTRLPDDGHVSDRNMLAKNKNVVGHVYKRATCCLLYNCKPKELRKCEIIVFYASR